MSGMSREDAIKNVTTYVLMECENMPIQVIKALDIMRECTEKQIPKKPKDIDEEYGAFVCSSCGSVISSLNDMTVHQYCLICGNAIDWLEEEDSL